MVKNLPANAGESERLAPHPWVGKTPLEKGMATHSSILLTWRIPWNVNSPWGRKESDTTERLSLSFVRKSVCVCVCVGVCV